MKPSEKSKNTNELMQILSSAKTPEELQAYTETLKQEHISCSFVDFISEKLRERELSAADLIRKNYCGSTSQFYDPAKLRLSASQRNQNTFQR